MRQTLRIALENALLIAALLSSAIVFAQESNTLAILPFENNSITERDLYEPLSKGLAAMLISDLSRSDTELKLIERGKIQALLKEIVLGQTGMVDESTAIKAGKLLGAQNIAFGSFVVLGSMVRIDTRIIKVETSELVKAESISGDTKDFLKLQQGLALQMADSLQVAFSPKTSESPSGIDAALIFSKALDALDSGDREKANLLFSKAIELDPAYEAQISQIEGLE